MKKGLVVLKLGGAQARGRLIRRWLEAVAANAPRLVLVPGGGPFADVVRATQAEIGFDDAAAHEMALFAMHQFGRALVSLRPGFSLARTEAEIAHARAIGLTPVWSPAYMALNAALPATWDLTSDSLAAWLAGRLRAARLILVKHGAPGCAADLVDAGVVDPLFPKYLRASAVPAFIAPPEGADLLGEALDGTAYPAIRVDP